MWKVTLSELVLTDDDRQAVADALASNWLTMGERTRAFEAAFGAALDADDPPHCVAVGNGTAALHLALLALDVGPGDEVIVPSLTFVASVNAVLYTGATAVLGDVTSSQEPTLSPAAVEALITERTAAVMPVHYAGQPGEVLAIRRLCDQAGIHVVEDAAHSPLADAPPDGSGAIHPLGTIGSVGCMSFFSNKNMTTGEGGMAVTRDPDIAARLRLLRSHGMTSLTLDRHKGHAHGYDCTALGWNYRLDEVRAALGLSQLGRLPQSNLRRVELVARYHERLATVDGVEVPFAERLAADLDDAERGRRLSPHILPVLLPEGTDRDAVQNRMHSAGVQTSVHYRPIHTFTLHQDHERVRWTDLSVTDSIASRLLTLPLYATMTEDEMDLVVATLKAALTDRLGSGSGSGSGSGCGNAL